MAMNTNLPALILGNTTAELATKRGVARQVVADVAKNTLVLMDGAKNGGHPMAKEERRIISTSNALSLNNGVSADLSGDINLGFNPDAVPPTGYEAIKEAVAAAKAAGQIGNTPFLGNVDADSLTQSGAYYVRMQHDGDYNVYAKHWPRVLSARTLALVFAGDNPSNNAGVRQMVIHGYDVWIRNGDTSGAFAEWIPVQTSASAIYISKSGNDANTGLDAAYPVLTWARAAQILRGMQAEGSGRTIRIYWGAGDWGNVGFSFPSNQQIQFWPYDGAIPIAYSASLPKFGTINLYGGTFSFVGCIADFIAANDNCRVQITRGYKRINAVYSGYGSYVDIANGAYVDGEVFEVGQCQAHQGYVLAASNNSVLNVGRTTFKLVENVTDDRFLSIGNLADAVLHNAITFNANGKTFTGRKVTADPGGSRISSGEGISESGLLPVLDRMFGYSFLISRGTLLDGIAVNN